MVQCENEGWVNINKNRRRCAMGYFVGIDLHGDNNYIGILDEEDRRVFKRKNRNDIKEITPVRDLLRKRMMLVQQRTAHILSMQTMVNRNKGIPISSETIKKMSDEEVEGLFGDEHLVMSAQCDHEVIEVLSEQIDKI